MRTHAGMCRWWWLAPIVTLALVIGGSQGQLPGCPTRAAKRQSPVVFLDDNVKVAVPDRNLVNTTDKNISLNFAIDPDEKGVLWKARLGKTSYAGPVIAGGKVFVCTNNDNPRDPAKTGDAGIVMCFDAKTGKFLWQAFHEVLGDESRNFKGQGIASTPFVEGNSLYYVSNRCELVCADVNGDPQKPGQAKFNWKLDMIGELNVFPTQLAASSPIVYGDLVFVLTGNGNNVDEEPWKLPSPNAPSFIAVNKKTGKVKWKDGSPGKNIMEGQWASPAVAQPKGGKAQAIFPAGDGWLYSFEAETGKLLWKFNCNPKSATFNFKNKTRSTKAHFLATPVVWEDRVYIGVGCNPDDGPGVGHLWCIDITKTGDVSPVDDIFDPKNAKNKNSALVWHHGGKIDPEPERGRKFHFGRTCSTVAIMDGLLYIGELDGYLHCYDAATGKRHWVVDVQSAVWASPYVVDGKVFMGNEDGDLHVYAHGKEMKRLAKISIGPGVKTPVKVVDGVLYVMCMTDLYAIKPAK